MSNSDALPPPHLAIDNLTVSRGERVLFHNLTRRVFRSGILFIRGPNGIGKSTLLLTIARIVRPDSGAVSYRDGAAEPNYADKLHLLTYRNGIKARLSVLENLKFWARLNGPTGAEPADALDRVGLADLAALEAGYLSSGQHRRLALARLLVSTRPLWLLDEPTAALDTAGQRLVAQLIEEHSAAGGITLAATHDAIAVSTGAAIETLELGVPA